MSSCRFLLPSAKPGWGIPRSTAISWGGSAQVFSMQSMGVCVSYSPRRTVALWMLRRRLNFCSVLIPMIAKTKKNQQYGKRDTYCLCLLRIRKIYIFVYSYTKINKNLKRNQLEIGICNIFNFIPISLVIIVFFCYFKGFLLLLLCFSPLSNI